MPEKKAIQRARRDRRQGKSPSNQAGEFVHEEIEHLREGAALARPARTAARKRSPAARSAAARKAARTRARGTSAKRK